MPPKKKSSSLFNMLLRNGKGHGGGASSSIVQSTPLNSPENPHSAHLAPSRRISNSASISAITPLQNEGGDFFEKSQHTERLPLAVDVRASFSLPPPHSDRIDIPLSGHRFTPVQNEVGASLSQLAGITSESTQGLSGTNLPLSWDTCGLPSHHRDMENFVGDENLSEDSSSCSDSTETLPTRILTPTLETISHDVLKLEVELSSHQYRVKDPKEYLDRIKSMESELKSYVQDHPHVSIIRANTIFSTMQSLIHRLQGARPRSKSHTQPPFTIHRDSVGISPHGSCVSSSQLEARIGNLESHMSNLLSSQQAAFNSHIESIVSNMEARIARNVQSSVFQECENLYPSLKISIDQIQQSMTDIYDTLENFRLDIDYSLSSSDSNYQTLRSELSELSRTLAQNSGNVETLWFEYQRLKHSIDEKLKAFSAHSDSRIDDITSRVNDCLVELRRLIPNFPSQNFNARSVSNASINSNVFAHSHPVPAPRFVPRNACPAYSQPRVPMPGSSRVFDAASKSLSDTTHASISNEGPQVPSRSVPIVDGATRSTQPPFVDPTVIFPGTSRIFDAASDSSTDATPSIFNEGPRTSRLGSSGSSSSNHKLNRLVGRITECSESIREITSRDMNHLTKAQVMEICSYDLKNLQNLSRDMKDYEKKLENLCCDHEIFDLIEESARSCRVFEKSVDRLRRAHFLHLASDKSMLKKLELDVFDGSPEKETVYNFLSLFFRLTDGVYSPADQAAILYSTYLSDSIQKECESFKTDINAVKDWLICQYGDLRHVVDSKIKAISLLKHPDSSCVSKIEYFKKIIQLLLHIESLANNEFVNSAEIKGIIYNASFVKNMLAFLPDFVVTRFSELVQSGNRSSHTSGHDYFRILKELIDSIWRELDTFKEIKGISETFRTSSDSKKQVHTINVKPKKSKKKNKKSTVVPSEESCYFSRSLSFPCTLHGTASKPDHDLGYCKMFFEMDNLSRFQIAKQSKLCFTCLKHDCLAASSTVCISNVPPGLICSDCGQNSHRRTPNILICWESSHKRPSLKSLEADLVKYLKAVNKNLVNSLKFQFNIISTAVCSSTHQVGDNPRRPKSKSSSFDSKHRVPKFDTQHGTELSDASVPSIESKEDSIYIFQSLRIADQSALVFYDSGATSHCVRGKFAESVGFKVVDPTNKVVGAFGNQNIWTDYGTYKCILGSDHASSFELYMQGIENITGEYPSYSLSDINDEVRNSKLLDSKERLPIKVGGSEVDILIGIKTPELIPKLLFHLPSGLAVFRCQLVDSFGSTIAYGGSHACISNINRNFSSFSVNNLSIMLSHMASSFYEAPWCDLEISSWNHSLPGYISLSKHQTNLHATTPLVGSDLGPIDAQPALMNPITCSHNLEVCSCDNADRFNNVHIATEAKDFVAKAKIPLERKRKIIDPEEDHLVTYRCQSCADCQDCKTSPTLQSTSIRDRVEDKMIQESIRISLDEKKTYVHLPFLNEPVSFFKKHFNGQSSNYRQAESVYFQQCRKPSSFKEGIRAAFDELLAADFIGDLEDAPLEVQTAIDNAEVLHLYPWSAVMKQSATTPVRLVVDPSSSHLNLNVAKGSAGLTNMHSILLKSRAHKNLWTSDVSKLYNCLYLETEAIPYSLFLYHPNLDPSTKPKIFYMKRAWYGVRCVGPQASATFHKLADLFEDTHPLGAAVLRHKTFADDMLSGTDSYSCSQEEILQVQHILAAGGFSLKFIAHDSESPPDKSSMDGEHILILGYSWNPVPDTMSLNIPEMNFQKKSRGLKPPNSQPIITADDIESLVRSLKGLTRRQVVGKSSELFDSLGLIEPFKAALKRMLSEVNHLDWKDKLSVEATEEWIKVLKMWPSLAEVSFPRSTVPPNAVHPLEPRLICLSDASADCGGVCLYLSFKLEDGSWSSQILAAKSRLLKFSVPRNELEMIELASELVFAAVVSLDFQFKHILIATDSLVALSWCCNERIRHKVYVMNRVLAITRFVRWSQDKVGYSCPVEIVHIPGNLNPADLLTKGAPSVDVLQPGSVWQVGYDWMNQNVCDMPLTRYEDISLSQDQVTDFLEEAIVSDLDFLPTPTPDSKSFLYTTFNDIYEGYACIVKPQPCQSSKPSVMINSLDSTPKNSVRSPIALVDIVHVGWEMSNLILEKCIRFGLVLIHQTHLNSKKLNVKKSLFRKCSICILAANPEVHTSNTVDGYEVTDLEGSYASTLVHPILDVENSESVKSKLECQGDIFLDSSLVGSECNDKCVPILNCHNTSTQLEVVMPYLNVYSPTFVQLVSYAVTRILDFYWNILATKECLRKMSKKDLVHYEVDRVSGLLFYKGRVGKDQKISVQDLDMLQLRFLDSDSISYHAPCILSTSDIFYALAIHYHTELVPHSSEEATLREISKRFHVVNPRRVLTKILKDCVKCKLVKKEVLAHEMANHSNVRFTYAPPFTFLQCDIAQHFYTKTRNSGRQTMKTPCLVVCCLMSGALGIYMMEDWSTESTISALTRHSNRYGVPSVIYIDSGSQLKALKNVTFDMQDLSHTLHRKLSTELVIAPPKSHVNQGRVERRIGLVKDMLQKLGEPKFLQSFLSWETLFSSISNYMNDLPIARASARSVDRPEYTVLTANRLLVGRNNSRSLAGPFILDSKLSCTFERALEAQETFFELLHKQLFLLIPRSKWFSSDEVQVGDMVIFFFDDSPIKERSRPWHLGRVISISENGSRLLIEYTIGMSNTKKCIERSKRNCCRIASEDELILNTHEHKTKIVQ